MAESRETGPAVARTCLGGLTLLLALTLSVRSAAVTPGSATHRPAMVHAVTRFFVGVVTETLDTRPQTGTIATARALEPGPVLRPVTIDARRPDPGLRLELLNLPPPACA